MLTHLLLGALMMKPATQSTLLRFLLDVLLVMNQEGPILRKPGQRNLDLPHLLPSLRGNG